MGIGLGRVLSLVKSSIIIMVLDGEKVEIVQRLQTDGLTSDKQFDTCSLTPEPCEGV